MKLNPNPAERVAAGAAYMDEHHPGWERKVDLSILDISDSTRCICGQALGECGYLQVSESIYAEAGPAECCLMTNLGFAEPEDGDYWAMLLKERFDSGLLSDMVD